MPRKICPISSTHPYFITVRCNNKEWFPLPPHQMWDLMEDYLFFLHHAFGARIYAFILMSNHFHTLMRFPEANVGAALQYFLRETSKQVGTETGRINHLYGGANHKSLILSDHHYRNVYKYLLLNPVRAGLCKRVEEYEFSSLHGLLGQKPLRIPIEEDRTLFTDFDSCLNWLNKLPDDESTEAIRRGLRLSVFELKTLRSTGRPSRLITELY